MDTDEYIAWKQREIEGNPQSVAPLALHMVEGQVMLDLPHAQVLAYALLMARIRVDREPFRRGLRIRRQFQGVAARWNDLLLRNIRHGFFAILAWAGFHPRFPRGCKRTPKTRRKLWAGTPKSSFRLRLRPMRIRTRAENTIAWAHGSGSVMLRTRVRDTVPWKSDRS